MSGEKKETLTELEREARDTAEAIAGALRPGIGFALLIFDYGEAGGLAYMSNGDRADVVRAMREWIERAEKGLA